METLSIDKINYKKIPTKKSTTKIRLIVCVLLILTITILCFLYNQQKTHNSKLIIKKGNNLITLASNSNIDILFISDIHVDPQYCPLSQKETDSKNYVSQPEVSSCKPFTIGNMFNSVAISPDNYGKQEKKVNPPITALSGVMKDFIKNYDINNNQKLLLCMGDVLRHKAEDFNKDYDFEQKAITTILREMKSKFDKDSIFYTIGNNGAEHGAPCKATGGFIDYKTPTTMGWADALIDQGIINNDLEWKYSDEKDKNMNQVDFFRKTGQYVKKVPSRNLYVIIINAMGTDDTYGCKMQNIYGMIDCDRIPENSKAYLISHFCYWRLEKCITCKIAKNCKKIVNYLCGHKHKEEPYFGKAEYANHIRIPAITRAHGPELSCPCYSAATLKNNEFQITIENIDTYTAVKLSSLNIDI